MDNNVQVLQGIVRQFRVSELQTFLVAFNQNKFGRKDELLRRALELTMDQRSIHSVAQKIREIDHAMRRGQLPSGSTLQPSTLSQHNNLPSPYGHPPPPAHMRGYQSAFGGGAAGNASIGQPYRLPHPQMHQQAASNRVRQLKISNLPFYDPLHTILDLIELPAAMSGQKTQARQSVNFNIPDSFISQLNYGRHEPALPRVEIQLRFFLLELGSEQKDDFPLNCQVQVDARPVVLPNIIPTNKPNVEPKRLSRPVNLSVYCQPPRGSSDRPHQLDIEWTADKRAWAFALFIVRHQTANILLQRLVTNVAARRARELTQQAVIRRLNIADGDGIEMETQRVSLLCPIGKTRMKIPIRPVQCTHLQCFDAELFLLMNEKKPMWKCAVCDNAAHYSQLVIDTYFEHLLGSVDRSVTEAELLRDGSWRAVINTDSDDGSSDDDVMQQPASKKRSAMSANGCGEKEVITLSDSDEEETRTTARTNANKQTGNAEMLSVNGERSPGLSDVSDQSVILLSDPDEPDPLPPTHPGPSSSSPHALASSTSMSTPTPVLPAVAPTPMQPWMMGVGGYAGGLPPTPANYYPYEMNVNNYQAMFQASALPDYTNAQVNDMLETFFSRYNGSSYA